MTQRDRTVLMVVGVVLLAAAFWFLALKPKRAELADLRAKTDTAQTRLDSATSAVQQAERARATYATDYATVARLGKAVPADDDTASLVFQLERAADRAHVDFRSIQLAAGGGSTPAATNSTPSGQAAAVGAAEKDGTAKGDAGAEPSTPAPPTQTAAAALPPGATVGPAGFPTMPFDFTFDGRFFRLEDFLSELDAFTRTSRQGAIAVRGRLLTVDGISVQTSADAQPEMTAQIHATAYLLPADQGLTGGATASGPAGAPAAAGGTTGTPVSSTTTSSTPATPVATAGVTR